MIIKENYSLLRHNTFNIKAKAKQFVILNEPETDLDKLSSIIPPHYFILGSGSNVLFTKDFDGSIIKVGNTEFSLIREDEQHVYIQTGASLIWDDFVAACIANGWFGLENLSDIPGTVGAAPVQNIGAYGVEINEFIESVSGYDLKENTHFNLDNKACNFEYRNSYFKKEKQRFLITSVIFKLNKAFTPVLTYNRVEDEFNQLGLKTAMELRLAIKRIRREKLPLPEQLGNAGSFFKNPIINAEVFKNLQADYNNMPFYEHGALFKIPAAWLIEQSGLKGYRTGDAGTHIVQPLVMVNYGNASGEELLQLSQQIINTVKSKFNITLLPEVNIL